MSSPPYHQIKNIIFLIILGLLVSISYGFRSPIIHYLSLENGLSNVTINDIAEDDNGFIWVATQNGLNRFDGSTFATFFNNSQDSTSLCGNHVYRLKTDHKGNLWVGTLGDGMSYYHSQTGIFHSVKLPEQPTEIYGIVADKQQQIWTATSKGLMQIKNATARPICTNNYLPNETLTAISIQNERTIWVGTMNGKVFSFNPKNQHEPTPLPTDQIKSRVRSLLPTKYGTLIGTAKQLYLWNDRKKELQLIKIPTSKNSTAQTFNKIIATEQADQFWLATGNGLYRHDLRQQQVIQHIVYDEDDDRGLSSNYIIALHSLPEQKLLVGTTNQLNLLDFATPRFTNISKNKTGQRILQHNSVSAILRAGENQWIGTSDGTLHLVKNEKVYYFNTEHGFTGGRVMAFALDTMQQRLWIATGRGLNLLNLTTFNPRQPKFKIFLHQADNDNSINTNYLKDIALDAQQRLWGTTNRHGIFCLDLNHNNELNVTRFYHQTGNDNSLINNTVHCIEIDEQGQIWLGSRTGLSILNLKNNDLNQPDFQNFYHQTDNPHSISPPSVFDITIDNQNKVWLATRNRLNLYQPDNTFRSWEILKAPASLEIYSLQDDLNGKLWLGTNQGIFNFNPDTETFIPYTTKDGIAGREFNLHTRYQDEKGRIYFGGLYGLTYFLPDDLKQIDRPVPLYFNQLELQGEVVQTGAKWLPKPLQQMERLTFTHRDFPFHLYFSTIDYQIHKNIGFAYRLLPNNSEWSYLKEPSVQFLDLPAGDYTLEVTGTSRGNIWEAAPLSLPITILPPWWATWQAYLLYLILLTVLTFVIYRFLLSRKLAIEETRRLQEISEVRNRFFANITHEFRTPLTVILGMTDIVKSNINIPISEEVGNALNLIQHNSERILKLVNDMLDLAKLESGKMEWQPVQLEVVSFIKYLTESFQSFAEMKSIKLMFYSELSERMMDIDAEKLSIIITNLVANAIKFTEENGNVVVHANQLSNQTLIIKVKDDGAGMTTEEQITIFDRFYQVSTSDSEYGTGIGLALTKELVELMNGQITVQSEPQRGSSFEVQLPITNNAPLATETATELLYEQVTNTDLSITTAAVSDSLTDSEQPLVLLIEDSQDILFYLKNCLKDQYQLLFATDGESGLALAFEQLPDLIISDIMMPKMDGFAVCEILKADLRTDHIPVILLTAKVTERDKLHGLHKGADAYLKKPFSKAELLTRTQQLISQRKRLLEKFQQDSFTTFLQQRQVLPEAQFLQKCIRFIQQEIDNPNLSSPLLARQLGLSESQLYRKLKATAGLSTALFIRSIRLKRAKELLLQTNQNISEIAYATGFKDHSWFSKVFKEEFGVSPSEMR